MSEERAQQKSDTPQTPAQAEVDNNSAPVTEDTPRLTRKEQDVLLDVSELEVEKITLEVAGLRAHVSILAQLANLVNLQVGVDARLNRVKLVIEGVRAKVLLKVWLDEVRAILEKDRKSTRLNSSHANIYTLSLHDALPILAPSSRSRRSPLRSRGYGPMSRSWHSLPTS